MLLNNHKHKLAASYSYWVLLFLFYSLASSQAIQSFSYKWTTIAVHEKYSLQKVLDGESPKPYIYRALVPFVVNFVVDNAPGKYLEKMRDRSANTLRANIGDDARLMSQNAVASYGVIIVLNCVFLVATLFALRAMGRYVLSSNQQKGPALLSDIAPVLFALMLSLSYRVHNGFVYDHLEMLCLSLYVLFTMYGRRLSCILLLAIAILNKETAIFFPFLGAAILLAASDMNFTKPLVKKFVSELLVVLCGYLLIRYIFRNAPGGVVEFHALGNLHFWFSIAPWLSITTPHMHLIPLPKPTNIVVLLPIVFSIFFAWSRKPNIIRLPLIVSCMINIPLFLLFSYRDEFRNLSLVFPSFYLASTHSIHHFYSTSTVSGEAC